MCVSPQEHLKHMGTLCEQDADFLSARRGVLWSYHCDLNV